MEHSYHKFLEIEIRHSYFQNSSSNVLNLMPLLETTEKLKQHTVLIQKNNNIVAFYAGISEAADLDLLTLIGALGSMYFQIVADDPLFYNYSDIPIPTGNELLYFQNIEDSNELQADLISVEDAFPAGQERLEIDVPILGLLHLNFESLAPPQLNEIKLSLNITARRVYWVYKIIIPESRQIQVHHMEILDIDRNNFNGPVQREIVGGQMASVFTSARLLPLRQKLDQHSLLKLTYSNQGSELTTEMEMKLPNATAENLESINIDGSTVWSSTIIVYV